MDESQAQKRAEEFSSKYHIKSMGDEKPPEILAIEKAYLAAYHDSQKVIEKLVEALEEMAKPPYKDSDLESLYRWVNARATSVLKEIK